MLVIDRLKIESSEALDLVVARVTFAAGDATGSGFRQAPILVVVERGSLTWYSADECEARTFTSGNAFAQADPGNGLVRNEGSIDAQAIVAFVAPPSQQGGV